MELSNGVKNTQDSIRCDAEPRGPRPFTLLARNSNGKNFLGISTNNRVSIYRRMMSLDPTMWNNILHQGALGMKWPTILAITGLITVTVSLYCYK